MTTSSPNNKDNTNKNILARACDPEASISFARKVPSLIGNATYVPTTDDQDFINKLESNQWSVVFFAPGACRLSAVNRDIPGGNNNTKGWTIEQYKILVRELQGDDVQIVETLDERDTIGLLNKALDNARPTT